MNLIHLSTVRRTITEAALPIVYVVDDDPTVREALEARIRSAGYQPCIAASAEEFLAQPRGKSACCLLVEKHLPGMSGLELQKLVMDRTEMPIIFMSSEADVEATVQAMKAGALEFFTKPVPGDALMHAIGQAIRSSHAALHHQAQAQALQQRYESLSRREREVMNLVVTGRLNKQVGGDARHFRDHREGAPRQDDAQDAGPFAGRAGEHGHQPARRRPAGLLIVSDAGSRPVPATGRCPGCC